MSTPTAKEIFMSKFEALHDGTHLDFCVEKAAQADDGLFESVGIFCAFVSVASCGSTDVVRLFLEANKKLANVVSVTMDTALIGASYYGHCETVRCLLEAGADINITNDVNQTALWFGVRQDHKQVVKTLIAAGADVNISNMHGSALEIATLLDRDEEIVRHLLSAGAKITPQCVKNANPKIALLLEKEQKKRKERFMQKQEWERMLDISFLLQPLHLPVLVVFEIYKALPNYHRNTVAMHSAWDILRRIKENK